MITIHNFPRGARGLRVFWQCEEMELPYQVRLVSFPPSEAYLALHPLGTVPFLEDDGGVAIHESVAMMLYLAQKYGPTPLLPGKDDPDLARVLEMTVFGETTIGAGLNPLLAARYGAPEGARRNWSVVGQEARVERAIRYVDDVMGGREFLAGPHLTLADISVSCALGIWEGGLEKPLPEGLVAYRARLAARPAYQRAHAKAHPKA
jgi:glutathione S-transferase